MSIAGKFPNPNNDVLKPGDEIFYVTPESNERDGICIQMAQVVETNPDVTTVIDGTYGNPVRIRTNLAHTDFDRLHDLVDGYMRNLNG